MYTYCTFRFLVQVFKLSIYVRTDTIYLDTYIHNWH